MPPSSAKLFNSLRRTRRPFLVAGPCVIESEELCFRIAKRLQQLCRRLGLIYVFKASYDKANRTSGDSFRGPGLKDGLRILAAIRSRLDLPVITDIHSEEQATLAAQVVDVLQIPAFLCRQTDLIQAAVRTGRIVNIKKGQFLSPTEMTRVVAKAVGFGADKLLLTERGTTFGYQNLVADMRSMPILAGTGFPIVFDATHSIQLPGAGGDRSSGQRQFAPVLARAAVAAGADGLFVETHPDPDQALSDGPNMIPLNEMPALLRSVLRVYRAVRTERAATAAYS